MDDRLSKGLTVRVDHDLLERVRGEAVRFGIDAPTYIKWCILMGLSIGDVNLFIRSRGDENTFDELPTV